MLSRSSWLRWSPLLGPACFCLPLAQAADLASESGPPTAVSLAERLQSPAFSERQEATLGLKRLGARAFPTLIEIAQGDNADARERALQILEEHLRQGDPQLQGDAQDALQELAAGEGAGARAADRILNPPPARDSGDMRRRIAGLQVMRAAQMQIQLQQRPAAPILPPGLPGVPAARTIAISISENGRTVRIQQKDAEIEIEVTEIKNGQKVVEKYQAKNVDELKMKHPAGHDIYQKYAPRFGLIPAPKADN